MIWTVHEHKKNPNTVHPGYANTSDGSWMMAMEQIWCCLLGHRSGWVLGAISLTLVQLWISDGCPAPSFSSVPDNKQVAVTHGMSYIWSEPEKDYQSMITLWTQIQLLVGEIYRKIHDIRASMMFSRVSAHWCMVLVTVSIWLYPLS